MKPIKQSVINTFNRVGIPYETLLSDERSSVAKNWLTGEECLTTPLIAFCIQWIYDTQLKYESGDYSIKVSDFDRVRYFIAEQEIATYMTCID